MQANGKASTTNTTFSTTCAVAITINAPQSQVWELLTDVSTFPNWNSTIISMSGQIADGSTVELVSTSDPKRTFKLKVSDFVPNTKMVWSDGMAPMFKGVRTYTLKPTNSNTTEFVMEEKFSGLMMPMIRRSLPNFEPFFEQFAADLKQTAESS